LLAVLVTAADPPAKLPADKPAAEYADPKATYRTYIEAIRKNDIKAAKQCWVIDDDKSGALDTMVGLWISMRQINQVAERKFGSEGLDAILKGWRRNDVADPALNLTKKRLDEAEVKITGNTAALKIKWRADDSVPNPTFEFREGPISFRKVGGNWKIDANKMTGLERGADFFEKGTWGRMFRDQVAIMNEAIDGMEKGKLKTAKELEMFIEGKIAAMTKKYEEERKKEAPKGSEEPNPLMASLVNSGTPEF
jgi:hypothetical protein